jgi:hypothetical protein
MLGLAFAILNVRLSCFMIPPDLWHRMSTNDRIVLVVDGSFSKFIAESSLRRKRERCLG